MKDTNLKSLENLSLFCHFCGLITMFFGIFIAFVHLLEADFRHIQIGIFMFAVGYAFVKISSKISQILTIEKLNN